VEGRGWCLGGGGGGGGCRCVFLGAWVPLLPLSLRLAALRVWWRGSLGVWRINLVRRGELLCGGVGNEDWRRSEEEGDTDGSRWMGKGKGKGNETVVVGRFNS
jgi:hypothetical protein